MDIVVLAGGVSTERDVSLSTGSKVCAALLKNGHRAVLVDVCRDYDRTEISKEAVFSAASDPEQASISEMPVGADYLSSLKSSDREYFGENVLNVCKLADIVFIALHGENGENGKLQACFDLHNIKYTGGSYFGCAIAMNKAFTRRVLLNAGIKMADGYCLDKGCDTQGEVSKIGYPCVVKAANGGSSIGVYIVNNDAEFKNALDECLKLDNEVVVEKYIKGREFSVGVLGDRVLPIIEIAPVSGFYDYKNKYQKGMAIETCPAKLSEALSRKMSAAAADVAKLLNSEVYCRIDFLTDEDEEIFCLEMNSLPGMTPTSLVPQEAAAVGISYEELCEMIISLSMDKYK